MDLKFRNLKGETLLNFSLHWEKLGTSRFLIQNQNPLFLMEDFEVNVKEVVSFKSNLHLLSEKGNFILSKLLLDRLDSPLKRKYLERMVLTELEHQRPRHLSCLHLAAMHGHTDLVDLFIQSGMNVNFTNNKNDSPVLWAVRNNHIETVKHLIGQGADLHLENDKGSTPLYWAVRYGYPDLVKVLVEEGRVHVNQKRKLGFFYPILLSCALGDLEIVQILISKGADTLVTISNNVGCLHVAAVEGHFKTIEYLLENTDLQVDQCDANGNTPLLFAAKNSKIRTIKLLVEKGADLNHKNKLGQGVWDFAIKSSNEILLSCVLLLYKQVESSREPSREAGEVFRFPVGKTPLHLAAFLGSVKKLRCLLNQGLDASSRDLYGNTFLHVAAKENQDELIEAFLGVLPPSELNYNGDSPLHVATRNGHLEASEILLKKYKLESKNKQGRTPLHEAALSDKPNPLLIRFLVQRIVKTTTWSLVDATDFQGNTALHLASKKNNPELIAEMSCLNPKILNKEGESPFHLAAQSGNSVFFHTMFSTFFKPETGVNLDQTNFQSETCLQLCARKCDLVSLETLITNGADLSSVDWRGNSLVHNLIDGCLDDKNNIGKLLTVYRCVVSLSGKWWCMKRNEQTPNEGSDLYFEKMRSAMIFLTSKLFNKDGLNCIEYAILEKCPEMLQEILCTNHVYKIQKPRVFLYDVTNMLPGYSGMKRKSNSVEDGKKNMEEKMSGMSYMNRIVSLKDEITASKMLNMSPFREMMANYWKIYQWSYMAMLFVHISYMILFSVFLLPPNSWVSPSDSTDQEVIFNSLKDKSFELGWFLLWPILILLFEVYYFIRIFFIKIFQTHKISSFKKEKFYSWFFSFLTLIFTANLEDLFSIGFCLSSISWFFFLTSSSSYSNYITSLSLVFLFGWIYLINFTKAIEMLHVFTIMLKYIVLMDITRYLAIYVIFLLGCGMAFHVLFQLHPPPSGSLSLGDTLYNCINTMLGLGEIFPDSFEENFSKNQSLIVYMKTLFIVYILVSTVILINLLIAMMTDTYTTIKSREASTWRVGTLKLALKFEHTLPLFSNTLNLFCKNRHNLERDEEFKRWMLPISLRKVSNRRQSSETDELEQMILAMDQKISFIQSQLIEISKQTDLLSNERSLSKERENMFKLQNIAQKIVNHSNQR